MQETCLARREKRLENCGFYLGKGGFLVFKVIIFSRICQAFDVRR